LETVNDSYCNHANDSRSPGDHKLHPLWPWKFHLGHLPPFTPVNDQNPVWAVNDLSVQDTTQINLLSANRYWGNVLLVFAVILLISEKISFVY
jgi:hypothetical protein